MYLSWTWRIVAFDKYLLGVIAKLPLSVITELFPPHKSGLIFCTLTILVTQMTKMTLDISLLLHGTSMHHSHGRVFVMGSYC